MSAAQKKKKTKQNMLKKTHLGQVFQSVTSFVTEFCFFSLMEEMTKIKHTAILGQILLPGF